MFGSFFFVVESFLCPKSLFQTRRVNCVTKSAYATFNSIKFGANTSKSCLRFGSDAAQQPREVWLLFDDTVICSSGQCLDLEHESQIMRFINNQERLLLLMIPVPKPSRNKWNMESASVLDFCKTCDQRPMGTAARCWLGDSRDDLIRYRPALLSLRR